MYKDFELIDKWVYISNMKKVRYFKDKKGFQKDGALGFIYVDHSAGLTLEIEYPFNGKLKDLKDNIDYKKDTSFKLRYDTFRELKFEILDESLIKKLNLPIIPEWVNVYKTNPQLDELRQIELLHQFRAPGYPDDIKVLLPPLNELSPEIVWGRLEGFNPKTQTYQCILLNQPDQDFKVNEEELVEVVMADINKEIYMLCKTSYDRLRI
ncbi:MAG: hypothetical protein H7A23_16240 [Leptospiraceae bacterium]|nr:hypothetical protein [Leptospiraceae bacterium]MCP5496097.1 hypothetical protein [Leptospiraceae bacterium]